MAILDPRVGVVAAGVAILGSERVRRTVGRGAGYAVAGAKKVGGPVIAAGQDIVEEARDVATGNGSAKRQTSRGRAASRR